MTTPLLTAKLYIPPVRPELVSRPRLIERLNAGMTRKFTLLITVVLLATACGGPALPASPPPVATLSMNSDPAPSVGSSRRAKVGSRTGPVQNLRLERISVEHGLSHSTVNCILQDSKGFMWFGTDDGLNKYDGHSFTVYKHNPDDPRSLSHNQIWFLFEDSSGVLWVGT
ncbi:MAG TPA: two-component regulator propeller domain-containing protein [Anaerolineae bacterium]|nr:two-component regulator propeller domain-containing protein [Anaerolineae bacterium]